MRIKKISITNFYSLYDESIELEPLVVFIGTNNSGKTTIMRAIRLIFENMTKFEKENIVRIYIPEEINTLWFFKNYKEPAVISAVVKLSELERSSLEKITALQNIVNVDIKTELVKIGNYEAEFKIKELTLQGYFLESSRKADEILKVLGRGARENYTKVKVVDKGDIVDKRLYELIISALKDKVHYINLYEGVQRPSDWLSIIAHTVLPQYLVRSLSNVVRDPTKSLKLIKYSQEITRSVYTESLEKPYKLKYFRFDSFGGGDQTVDALIAYILDKGEDHVFLIEEPETHLHPSYVKKLGRVLENIVNNEKVQIIISTHSPVLIKYLSIIDRTLYLVKKRKVKTIAEMPSTTVKRLKDVLRVPSWFIRRDLFFSEVILLVEGRSDEILFERFIDILREQLDILPYIHIGYIHYAERNLEEILDGISEISKFIDVPKFLIADGDEKGKEYVKKALEKGYKKDQEVFALEYQDIFFEVENKLLIDAIIELLTRLSEESIIKNEKAKEIIEIALKMLENDALGGSGSRGYGQVVISNKTEWKEQTITF